MNQPIQLLTPALMRLWICCSISSCRGNAATSAAGFYQGKWCAEGPAYGRGEWLPWEWTNCGITRTKMTMPMISTSVWVTTTTGGRWAGSGNASARRRTHCVIKRVMSLVLGTILL